MSGLLRRLTRRRPATADETGPPAPESSEPAAARAETPAEAGGDRPLPASGEQPTQVISKTDDQRVAADDAAGQSGLGTDRPGEPAEGGAQTATQPTAVEAQPARDLPAGVDPAELAVGPAASARRGKLRRRLRYLRRVRELLLRDLGGFVYEIHRTAAGTAQEPQRRLLETKAGRLTALDAEVRALEARLSEPHADTVLREPGIGGTCPECGELHGSDAHYCARCGAPLDARARAQREAAVAAAAQPPTTSHPTPEPEPASVLWAAGPRPRTHDEATAAPDAAAASEPDAPQPAPATSEWLAVRDQSTAAVERPAGSEDPTPDAATDAPSRGAESGAGTAASAAGAATDPSRGGSEAGAGTEAPAAGATDTSSGGSDADAGTQAPTGARGAAGDDEPDAADRGSVDEKRFGQGPNGRREEDAPSRVTFGDPLGSRSEPAP
jgi:hypothetical protein